MQNAANLGCSLIRISVISYVFLSYVRDIGMKFVLYWYQLFKRYEKLVPVPFDVKFSKLEITV